MSGFEFEFHWWMVLAVAALIAAALILKMIRDFFNRHPNLKYFAGLAMATAMAFVVLGIFAAAAPAGAWDVCTQNPSQCVPYYIKSLFSHR